MYLEGLNMYQPHKRTYSYLFLAILYLWSLSLFSQQEQPIIQNPFFAMSYGFPDMAIEEQVHFLQLNHELRIGNSKRLEEVVKAAIPYTKLATLSGASLSEHYNRGSRDWSDVVQALSESKLDV